jgi:hypothetical protein
VKGSRLTRVLIACWHSAAMKYLVLLALVVVVNLSSGEILFFHVNLALIEQKRIRIFFMVANHV